MRLIPWLVLASLLGCDPATIDTDNDFLNGGGTTAGGAAAGSTGTAAGTGTSGGSAGPAGPGGSSTGTSGTAGTAGTAGTTAGGTTGSGTTGIGSTGAPLGEGGVPSGSVIAGTYVNCTSYQAAEGDMCAGYYCSVTAADIAAELVPGSGPCSGLSAERVCAGRLSKVTATCSRSTKSNPLNALDDDATLRGKIEACIFEDADLSGAVSPECVSCFLDASQCASDNCLGECLAGDSAGCDQCRIDAKCNHGVPPCGGLPSSF